MQERNTVNYQKSRHRLGYQVWIVFMGVRFLIVVLLLFPQHTFAIDIPALTSPPMPPASYYGQIWPTADFTPTANLSVTAWIDGVLCGQTQTVERNGQITYIIDVQANWPGAPGCGESESVIRFYVDGQPLRPASLWDNGMPHELDLTFDPTAITLHRLHSRTNVVWLGLSGAIAVGYISVRRCYRRR